MSLSNLTNAPYLNISCNSVTAEFQNIQDITCQNLIVETAAQIDGPVNMQDDVIVQGTLQIGSMNNKYIMPNTIGSPGQYQSVGQNNLMVWTTGGGGGGVTLQSGDNINITEPSSNVFSIATTANVDFTDVACSGFTLGAMIFPPMIGTNTQVLGVNNGNLAFINQSGGGGSVTLNEGANITITGSDNNFTVGVSPTITLTSVLTDNFSLSGNAFPTTLGNTNDVLTVNNGEIVWLPGGGGSGNVNSIIAGTAITVSPTDGTGDVTVNFDDTADLNFSGNVTFSYGSINFDSSEGTSTVAGDILSFESLCRFPSNGIESSSVLTDTLQQKLGMNTLNYPDMTDFGSFETGQIMAITVDGSNASLSFTNPSADGVASLIAGNGITVSSATGDVTVSVDQAYDYNFSGAVSFSNSSINLTATDATITGETDLTIRATNIIFDSNNSVLIDSLITDLFVQKDPSSNYFIQYPDPATVSAIDSGTVMFVTQNGSDMTLSFQTPVANGNNISILGSTNTVNLNTTISGLVSVLTEGITINDNIFPATLGSDGDVLTIVDGNMAWNPTTAALTGGENIFIDGSTNVINTYAAIFLAALTASGIYITSNDGSSNQALPFITDTLPTANTTIVADGTGFSYWLPYVVLTGGTNINIDASNAINTNTSVSFDEASVTTFHLNNESNTIVQTFPTVTDTVPAIDRAILANGDGTSSWTQVVVYGGTGALAALTVDDKNVVLENSPCDISTFSVNGKSFQDPTTGTENQVLALDSTNNMIWVTGGGGGLIAYTSSGTIDMVGISTSTDTFFLNWSYVVIAGMATETFYTDGLSFHPLNLQDCFHGLILLDADPNFPNQGNSVVSSSFITLCESTDSTAPTTPQVTVSLAQISIGTEIDNSIYITLTRVSTSVIDLTWQTEQFINEKYYYFVKCIDGTNMVGYNTSISFVAN